MTGRRNQRPFRGIGMFAAAGAAYALWLRWTELAIPCLFRTVTGWLCPGCGITTLFCCLLELDFAGAYRANPFLFVTGPLVLAGLGCEEWHRGKGKRRPRWLRLGEGLYCAALVFFGVWRNL